MKYDFFGYCESEDAIIIEFFFFFLEYFHKNNTTTSQCNESTLNNMCTTDYGERCNEIKSNGRFSTEDWLLFVTHQLIEVRWLDGSIFLFVI